MGAVWEDAYPVLIALLKAFDKLLSINNDFKIEFYGTSYAGAEFSKPQVKVLVDSEQLKTCISENSQRVAYQKAIELTCTADINILFGGMKPYYAASKLMGLIVSQKPFIAFMHRDSFPAFFLKKLNYKYLLCYSNQQSDKPENHINELTDKLKELISSKSFEPISLDMPEIKENTANGMTFRFVNEFNKIIK